jgi:uncharacterized protein YggE
MVGYESVCSMTVRTKNLTEGGAILALIMEGGAKRIDGVSFQISQRKSK